MATAPLPSHNPSTGEISSEILDDPQAPALITSMSEVVRFSTHGKHPHTMHNKGYLSTDLKSQPEDPNTYDGSPVIQNTVQMLFCSLV